MKSGCLCRARRAAKTQKVWLALEGGAYVSTGHNSGGQDYKAGRIGMFAFEPMLEFRYAGDISRAYDRTEPVSGAVYGGVGVMINRFIVKGATPAFTKYGVKLRPIAITFSGCYSSTTSGSMRRVHPDGSGWPPMETNRPLKRAFNRISIPWLTWRLWR